MLFELCCNLDDCASPTHRQELDILMQNGWKKYQIHCGFLNICDGNHTWQIYLGVKLIEKTLIAHIID